MVPEHAHILFNDHIWVVACWNCPKVLYKQAKVALDSLELICRWSIINRSPTNVFRLELISQLYYKSFSSGFDNSLEPAAGTDGVRITIQQPDTIPNPSLEGFDIPPGVSATIGVMEQTWYFHRHKFIHKKTHQNREENREESCTGSFTPTKSHYYWTVLCMQLPVKNVISGPSLSSYMKFHIWKKEMGQMWHFCEWSFIYKKMDQMWHFCKWSLVWFFSLLYILRFE